MMNEPRRLSTTETAKAVRKALKAAFPKTKFSVRSSVYSGGSSIDVRWFDGPTSSQVRPILSCFEGADFDGMQDLKTYREPAEWNGERVRFGVDFVHGQREISYARMVEVAEAVCKAVDAPAVPVERSDYDGSGYVKRDGAPVVQFKFSEGWIEDQDRNAPSLDAVLKAVAVCTWEPQNLAELITQMAFATSFERGAEASPSLPQPITEGYIDEVVERMLQEVQ